MATTKTISIKREHEDWLIENNISLSLFVQEAIEEAMHYKKEVKTHANKTG